MASGRENVPYRALPGVVLVGVEVRRCPNCGEYEVVIPRIEELDRTIGRAVISKPSKLSGAEIRFLRKYLDLSGVDLARKMGTKPETVSRWESDKQPMGAQADRLLRLMVAYRGAMKDYLEVLETVATEDPTGLHQRVAHKDSTWELVA
jgi:putative zinc finger/helix-turn-helix YgiT family protein